MAWEYTGIGWQWRNPDGTLRTWWTDDPSFYWIGEPDMNISIRMEQAGSGGKVAILSEPTVVCLNASQLWEELQKRSKPLQFHGRPAEPESESGELIVIQLRTTGARAIALRDRPLLRDLGNMRVEGRRSKMKEFRQALQVTSLYASDIAVVDRALDAFAEPELRFDVILTGGLSSNIARSHGLPVTDLVVTATREQLLALIPKLAAEQLFESVAAVHKALDESCDT